MREQNWADVVDSTLLILWCVFIIGGCTYLVFWMNASGWWYLLALLLVSSSTTTYSKEMNEYLRSKKAN